MTQNPMSTPTITEPLKPRKAQTIAGDILPAAIAAMVDDCLSDNECDYGIVCSNNHACSSLTAGDGKSPSPAVSAHRSGKSAADVKEEDSFYQKLNKINESSGLSLLFNFRDTTIDLHQFYKIVTNRGGYHQVTKDRKWEEVAYCLTWEKKIQLTPDQLQQIYATILYPFEQTYYYRSPIKLNEAPIMINGLLVHNSMGKRMYDDGTYAPHYQFHDGESPFKKIQCDYDSWKSSQAVMFEEKKLVSETPFKVKEARKDPRAPLRARNCYQLFLKMECDRLKSIHGNTPSAKLRDMVIEAWRQLSNDDKQASKKDKERYEKEMMAYEEQMRKEMVAYEEHKRKQQNQLEITTHKRIKFSSPTLTDLTMPSQDPALGFHMVSHNDAENQKAVECARPHCVHTDGDGYGQVSNEPMVQINVGLMINATK